MGCGEFVLGSGDNRDRGLAHGIELPARTCVPGRTSFGGRKLMFTRLIWVIDETPHPAALNMAIDEALLCGGGDQPLFRTYACLRRALSLGYLTSSHHTAHRYSGPNLL